jgi:myb proto-oncogene protein
MLDGLKMPMDWSVSPVHSNEVPEYYQVPSLQSFDMGALQQHCGAFPSASSSSTVTGLSPAGADAGANLPWLELGPTDAGSGHIVDHYAGALDELRWSDYFDGAFHAAAPTCQGALQGPCVYDGVKVDDDAAQFDVHGLSNWC